MGPHARMVTLAATGRWPAFSWLDGGRDGRGWLGLEPDLEVEADSLDALGAVDEQWRRDPSRIWIGWLTYDVGAGALRGRAPVRARIAGLCMRRFAAAAELGPGASVRYHGEASAVARLRSHVENASKSPARDPWPLERLEATLAPAAYHSKVARARAHIIAGDTYQVNLSQRFFAAWRASSASTLSAKAACVYDQLRTVTPAGMGALLASSGAWIVSNSPETLLDVRLSSSGDLARSWPIKGTRPRHSEPARDAVAARELASSPKDLAEHVMIVDLVRSDLGRVARPGSVTASAQPELVSLPTVHHLVTQVQCVLRSGWSLPDLVAAMFPGGSVTGAPKRRTVEIIDTLEAEPRGIYCGAIAVLEPGGLRASIPIRTGILDASGLTLRSGGGIVIDSTAEEERLETLAKARAFDPPPSTPDAAGAGA